MFENRYVQLAVLWLVIAIVIYIVLFLIFRLVGVSLPTSLQVFVAALGSGYIVYQFFERRIG